MHFPKNTFQIFVQDLLRLFGGWFGFRIAEAPLKEASSSFAKIMYKQSQRKLLSPSSNFW